MKEKIKKVIASVFKIDKDSITDDFNQQNFEKWDSLQHINIVVALEEEFNISIEPDEIIEIVSIQKIEEVIKRKNLQR